MVIHCNDDDDDDDDDDNDDDDDDGDDNEGVHRGAKSVLSNNAFV